MEAAKRLEADLMIPAIVNITFSCELYLKEMLIKLGIRVPNNHLIKELFARLPIKYQTEIKKNSGILSFELFIEEINNAFVKWRYAYECSPLSISYEDCFRFVEALKHQCNEE